MKKLLPIFASALLLAPLAANAGPLEYNSSIPASGSVSGYLDFDGSADGGYKDVKVTNAPGFGYNGSGGQFQGYFSTTALNEANNPGSQFFRFFCIDLFQYATDKVTAYTASFYNNDKLRKLYDIAYPNKISGDFFNAATSTKTNFGQFADAGSVSRSDYSAAFQLSVWELAYETSATHDLDTGTFKDSLGTGKAHQIADQWLAQVDAYSGNGYQKWQLYRFDSSTNQDYVAASYVPEPGSLALLTAGLFGMMGLRRRAQRK